MRVMSAADLPLPGKENKEIMSKAAVNAEIILFIESLCWQGDWAVSFNCQTKMTITRPPEYSVSQRFEQLNNTWLLTFGIKATLLWVSCVTAQYLSWPMAATKKATCKNIWTRVDRFDSRRWWVDWRKEKQRRSAPVVSSQISNTSFLISTRSGERRRNLGYMLSRCKAALLPSRIIILRTTSGRAKWRFVLAAAAALKRRGVNNPTASLLWNGVFVQTSKYADAMAFISDSCKEVVNLK